MKTHDLKIAPEYFKEVLAFRRRFELRRDDRGFKKGDKIRLREYTDNRYTGREYSHIIKYILRDCPYSGLKDGYVILSF